MVLFLSFVHNTKSFKVKQMVKTLVLITCAALCKVGSIISLQNITFDTALLLLLIVLI